MATHDDRIEELLADALAVHDERGQSGLDDFLRAHAAERTAIERGLARCRQLGLLGDGAGNPRDFPERLGEFELVRRLGSGGMGVVYEAEQQSLGRRVALKVVRPELLYFEGARERFRREIEAVARLSHPNVVPVLASGEQDGVPWYAMELLHGLTVHDVCDAVAGRDPATLRGEDLRAALGPGAESSTDVLSGPWWQVCARIAHAVALGVRHAHLRGIVHRDIKPSNVMLTLDGRTVLLDFGVAMLGGGREFTRTGATPGSPAFMSPEQLRGDAVDERTDVYSLGATLWQMLTLRPPFRGDDLQRIRDGAVESVAVFNREVPRELVIVLQKAMDRDRERRYVDIDQFAQDLVAVLHRRPIRARRLELSLRAWRWCQRHRVLATACASLVVTALALPAAFAWRERSINDELAAAAQLAHESAALAQQNEAKAQRSAQLAEESLATTLDAIDSLLVRVGNEKFRYVPAASRIAEESLAEAVKMFQGLLAKHPDHVRLHVDAGKAIGRYADFLMRRAANDEAFAWLRRGIEQLRGDEMNVPPEWLETRSVLGINFGSWSEQIGDTAAATRAFDAAERDLAALAAHPRFALGVLRGRVELATQRAGRHDPLLEREAMERDCLRALDLARTLHAREPDNVLDTRQLVEQLDMTATMWSKQGRYDEAQPLLDEAQALARALPADAPFWPPQPLLVAKVLETLGNLYTDRRDRRAAAALKECLQLRERSVEDYPQDAGLRCELAAALHNLSLLNFWQGQDELALERVDRAIALQRGVLAELPKFARALDYLRRHLVQRGTLLAQFERTADLQAVATELSAMQLDRNAQRSAARLWCRLWKLVAEVPEGDVASQEQCVQAAIAALQRAEALGWGPGQSFADNVYAPLRGRPDFDALVARISARTAPAKER
jgi:serine/threonine protein kinase/tetratricopeptide (TPR) repeat protein